MSQVVGFGAEHLLALLLHLCLVFVVAWDIWAWATGRRDQTVSFIVQAWSKNFPIMPLLAGIILGHLFWPQ